MDFQKAETLLHTRAQTATRMKARTILGQLQYEVLDPYCVLVVKEDPQVGLVCVTVLPRAENYGGFSDDEMDIIREAYERLPSIVPPTEVVIPKGPPPKPKERKPIPGRPIAPRPAAPESMHQQHERKMAEWETKKAFALAEKTKEEEKTKRHFSTMNEQLMRQRQCLKFAIAFLLRHAGEGDNEAVAILEQIQLVDPAFVTEDFMSVLK